MEEALAADRAVEAGAAVYGADDVHDWLERLANREVAARPKPIARVSNLTYSECRDGIATCPRDMRGGERLQFVDVQERFDKPRWLRNLMPTKRR